MDQTNENSILPMTVSALIADNRSLTDATTDSFIIYGNKTPSIVTKSPEIESMGGIAYGVVAPLIISFGIVSNLLNLLVLTRPSLRSPTFR